MATGELVTAIAMFRTRPPAQICRAVKTTAVSDGDHYVLKRFQGPSSPMGLLSDLVVVVAKTGTIG